jgi:hypothetical protein
MMMEQPNQTRTRAGAVHMHDAQTAIHYAARPVTVCEERRETPAQQPSPLRAAVVDLGTLFAEEQARSNSLLAQQGRGERIVLTQHGIERRYALEDATVERHVSLFVCVPAVDGHAFGGAFVATSKTPPYIYLMPLVDGAKARWIVTATSAPFGRTTVRDLFAAAFGDDEEATARITPLVGFDLFNTPWS